MEFASPEDLRAFLARWLEEHGHSVYRQVPCPGGEAVDILTQDYTIDCHYALTPADLWAAADRIQAGQPHFPDQRPVIAGLTPDANWEEAYKIVEQLKPKGIEVWFIDQMPAFTDYYTGLVGAAPARVKAKGLNRRSPLAGCAISLGMAAILSLSFWVAYRILDRHQIQVATNSQEGRAWEQLHNAVQVWDMDSSLSSLEKLSKSRSQCTATFAERFEASLKQRGEEGFRDINPIKRALNSQDGCSLEMREYDFSP